MAELATPGTDDYSTAELLAVLIARQSAGEDEVWGGGGANHVVSLAGSRLAQLTAAPNLWLFTGGAGTCNGKFDRLPKGTWDPRCGHQAECRILISDIVDGGTKGRAGEQRVRRAGAGFGGIQVDKYGNINMIGIGEHPRFKFRGPGTVGTIWMGSGPSNVYLEHHNKRVLVDKVAYISGAGWLDGGDSRRKALGDRDGPQLVWTPLCVCDFTEDDHRMRLASVHPGHTVEEVVANTGFELVIPETVPTTTPPSDWELQVLRSQVDRDGALRRRRMTFG